MEGLKVASTIFFWDADAIVGDVKDNLAAATVDAKYDRTSDWRVFDGVGDKVVEDVPQQGLIGIGVGEFTSGFQGKMGKMVKR